MLEVQGLTVRYPSPRGEEVRAVEGVTVSIDAGEAVGLLGESGCGKTSIALSLLRLPPAAGCTVRGDHVLSNAPHQRLGMNPATNFAN